MLRTCLAFLALALALTLLPAPTRATPVAAPHLRIDLLADVASVEPGRDLTLGLHFVLDDGFHIYWRNPGDSGEAPSVTWTLPAGFRAGDLEWPTPDRIDVPPLTDFGYSRAVLLPVTLHVPTDLAGAPTVDVRAQAKWLVCDAEGCVPGKAPLALTLPVGTATPQKSSAARLFEETRARLPSDAPKTWRLTATATPDAITLVAVGVDAPLDPKPLFFPFGRETIEHAAPQTLAAAPDGFRLTLTPWHEAPAPPRAIAGILTVGGRAYGIDVPVAAPAMALDPLLLAFTGGLLLNLMPCVFPVLALKALALVGLARQDKRRVRCHGLVYALGIVVSFWVLASVLLAVRAGGAQLGWGFQLQSPVAIAVLASVFFWMALTLLGVSTVGGSLVGVGSRLAAGSGYRAAFFAGVLATVVATPCTAPFMGTALGYALVQPPAVALGVFTSLGIGLALPYVVLTFVPALGRFLPRPGRWMETLEQLLAFPLLATVVWLVWVASLQAGPDAVLAILASLVLLGLAAWVMGHWASRGSRIVAAAIVVVALGIEARIVPSSEPQAAGTTALAWEPYSTERLDALLRTGTPVFVDFTAAWCVTCQVNERLVLTTSAVANRMKAIGVVPVRADWTRPNPDISHALQQFGRDGVPLYVLYSGKAQDPPRILPQILTTETVLTELEQLETRRRT